jgi:uncharacterized membrane protein
MPLIKYFLIIIISAGILSLCATAVVNKGLTRSGVDFYGKINAATDASKNTSLLIVGSSRALVHLDPYILDSVTGLNSFNYGLNSGSVKTWYNLIKSAVNFQPNVKAIILNVDYSMFDPEKDPYKDAYYYPVEKKIPGLMFYDSGKVDLMHRAVLFDISLYDDYAKYAAIDGWLRPGRVSPGVYKGYYPYQEQRNNFNTIPQLDTAKKEVVFSSGGVKIFNDFIYLCKQKNIKLICVMAPYYKKYTPEKYCTNFFTITDSIRKISQKNNIPFFDLSNTKIAWEKDYFFDINHLNKKGASVYSLAVADSLKNYLIVD